MTRFTPSGRTERDCGAYRTIPDSITGRVSVDGQAGNRYTVAPVENATSVVEVARTSLSYDRLEKLSLYAYHTDGAAVLMHRQPAEG